MLHVILYHPSGIAKEALGLICPRAYSHSGTSFALQILIKSNVLCTCLIYFIQYCFVAPSCSQLNCMSQNGLYLDLKLKYSSDFFRFSRAGCEIQVLVSSRLCSASDRTRLSFRRRFKCSFAIGKASSGCSLYHLM